MSGAHTLVLGGARSGKSALAERMALSLAQNPAYIATGQAFDAEMKSRIDAHKNQRDARFKTIEEPIELCRAIEDASGAHDVILVDCLTLWISNLMGSANADMTSEINALADLLRRTKDSQIILVSNEVGLGLVPETAMGRQFRDHAGAAHQILGGVCTNVLFVAAGLPLALKGVVPDLN